MAATRKTLTIGGSSVAVSEMSGLKDFDIFNALSSAKFVKTTATENDITSMLLAMDASNTQLKLGSGTLETSAVGGVAFASSNVSLIGDGIDKTIIRNISTDSGTPAMSLGACENVVFYGITFHGANAAGAVTCSNDGVMRNIFFIQCKFTSEAFESTNGVRWVSDIGLTDGLYFIDCVFQDCGRMGLEIQNHGAGDVVRIKNVYLIRPRIINCGEANATGGYNAAMGISLTGYGDNVLIESPYFDGNKEIQLENVGFSRVTVNNAVVNADTLPDGKVIFSFSNSRPMYDCQVNGVRFVADNLGENVVDFPIVSSGFYFDNCKRLTVKNITGSFTSQDGSLKVVLFDNDCVEVDVSDCHLVSDNDTSIIEFLNVDSANTISHSRIKNTSATQQHAIANFGKGSVNVSDCIIDMASGDNYPFSTSGDGEIKVVNCDGVLTESFVDVTVPSGANFGSVAHDFGVSPRIASAFKILAHGGLFSFIPAANNSIVSISTSSNMTADVTFRVHLVRS